MLIALTASLVLASAVGLSVGMTTDQSTGANSVRVEGTTQMAENELHVDMQLSTYAAEDPLRQRLTGFGVVAAGLAVAVVVGRTVLGGRTD